MGKKIQKPQKCPACGCFKKNGISSNTKKT